MSRTKREQLLSPGFALALQFANQIHGAQIRKGIGAPYISHLLAVTALVMEYGGDETQAIAALLHDAAEDCGGRPMLETVRVMFGDDVAEIVDGCTDTFENPKPDWRPRKEAYLRELRAKPARIKLVSCADKLSNLGNTLRDIRAEGVDAWTDRMAATKNGTADKQLWYYTGCRDALTVNWTSPMLKEFSAAVDQLHALVGPGARS
jgi:(p)ppGpp synthase/HD superfamily hydrolase